MFTQGSLAFLCPEAEGAAVCGVLNPVPHEIDTRFNINSLRLVCKSFQKVLQQNPSLCSALHLRKELSLQAMRPLLQWLRQNGENVCTVAAACGSPCLEAAFGAITGRALNCAVLIGPSSVALNILAGFSSLTICTLSNNTSALDLGSFRGLPNLQAITLSNGVFSTVGAAPRLKLLTLDHAGALCGTDNQGLSSLQALHLHHSILGHPFGVSASAALTKLVCIKSDIMGGEDARWVTCLQLLKSHLVCQNLNVRGLWNTALMTLQRDVLIWIVYLA